MLYFWILTVILFALPVGLVMLTWDRSQADARECVIRWQIIASALYFLATGPTSQGGETALLMMLLGALGPHRGSLCLCRHLRPVSYTHLTLPTT